MASGWLCFESGEERRRLYPVPEDWESLDDRQLLALCRQAEVGPPTRRISLSVDQHRGR
jgi:hypothetical protein